MIDALKRASASRITAVVPYFSYGRSDKKDQPRVPITARLVADMIQTAGANRVLTVDLHAGQVQGFFNIPVDELTAMNDLCNYINGMELIDPVVVAGDLGFAKRARNFANLVGASVAFVEKRRTGNDDRSESLGVIGDVRGKTAIIIDDEIDTAGSITNAAEIVLAEGAREVYAACTHALLTGAGDRTAAALADQRDHCHRYRGAGVGQVPAEHDHALGLAAAGRDHLAHPYRRIGRRALRRPSLTGARNLGPPRSVRTQYQGPTYSPMFKWISKLAGDSSEREVRKLGGDVDEINALESEYQALSPDELRDKTTEFRGRFLAGETLDDLLPEAFAAVREASRRAIGKRHYDVQLIAGAVLHSGRIAEMKTGEGKTLVATLPLYLNALEGKGAHLVTPNDYLSRLGGGWMGPVYQVLGLKVGVIAHEFAGCLRPRLQRSGAARRRAAESLASGAATAGLRSRYHVRNQQRVRFRLPSRQHAVG